MKLLSILALCAALCVAVTHASSQVEDEAVLQELLEIQADKANIETIDTDELTTAEEYAHSNVVNDNEARIASLRIAPLRIAPLRIAPLRIAPLRIAPLRIAPLRIAPLRIAPLRIPPIRLPTIRVGGSWKKK